LTRAGTAFSREPTSATPAASTTPATSTPPATSTTSAAPATTSTTSATSAASTPAVPPATPAAPTLAPLCTPSRRILQVTARTRSYLVVNQDFNAGWQARLGGTRLRTVRIDGWKQGWLLPAGTAGTVTLTYMPNSGYRDAIFGGLGTLALVVLV